MPPRRREEASLEEGRLEDQILLLSSALKTSCLAVTRLFREAWMGDG